MDLFFRDNGYLRMMRIPKLNVVEYALTTLILITLAMALHNRLPASDREVAALHSLAQPNIDASRMVMDELAAHPKMNKGQILILRDRITGIERDVMRPAPDPVARELRLEEARLAGISYLQMKHGDQLRWLVLNLGRYSPLIAGTFIGTGLLLMRTSRHFGCLLGRSKR